jgi:hypothetical protein
LLQNDTRKKLGTHGWTKMLEKESNKSQTQARIRSQISRTLKELTLLADQIPAEEAETFIPGKSVAELIATILKQDPEYFGSSPPKFKPPPAMMQLAYLLTQICMKFFISTHETQFDNTPTLASPAIEQLQKTVSICKEIAYLTERNESVVVAEKENRSYLFKWEELPGMDEVRLLDYLESEFGQTYFMKKIEKHEKNKIVRFYTQTSEGDKVVGKITLDNDYKGATMTFDNDPKAEDKRTLVVMRENNYTYLFKSRNRTNKLVGKLKENG